MSLELFLLMYIRNLKLMYLILLFIHSRGVNYVRKEFYLIFIYLHDVKYVLTD